MKTTTKNIFLYTTLLVCFLFKGGFFDFGVAITGLCLCLSLCIFFANKETFYKFKPSLSTWILVAILGISLLMTIPAVDNTLHLFGCLRILVILLLVYLLSATDFDADVRVNCINFLPFLMSVQTVLGLIALPVYSLYLFFYQADRFGGFFQYANTNALVYAIGLLVFLRNYAQRGVQLPSLFTQKIRSKKGTYTVYILLLLLQLTGLLMTGSRSMFVFFIAGCVYLFVRSQKLRLPLIIGGGATAAFIVVFSVISGSVQNIARILTLPTHLSTFWGRLLYNLDGIRYLSGHPFGLGHMGYYFAQGTFQTGVYTTRFIHNDLLQAGLDFGIPVMILLVFLLIYQLIKGKQTLLQKEVLLFIVISCLFDFHAQYMFILLLSVLCMDLPDRGERLPRKSHFENKLISGILALCFFYLTAAFSFHQSHNYEKCLFMLPTYTWAQLEQLEDTADLYDALERASALESSNPYIYEAHHMLAYVYAMQKDWEGMCNEIMTAITLVPYETDVYVAFDQLLTDSLSVDNASLIEDTRKEMRAYLASMENRTSSLSDYLRDQPVYSY